MKLNKNHPRNYTKKNIDVDCRDEGCKNKDCFRIHDFGYRRTDGKWIERFVCLTRENSGCK